MLLMVAWYVMIGEMTADSNSNPSYLQVDSGYTQDFSVDDGG